MSRSKAPPRLPDAELWRRVSADVAPLKKRQARAKSPPPAPAAPPPAAALPAPKPPPQPTPPRPRPSQPRPPQPPRPLTPGALVDLDKRTAERLRRGELPLQGRLDLHGMTQAAAHAALEAYLLASAARGKRCLLIVTGKGRGSDEWGRETGGVLRRMVPRWLEEPALRPLVLALAPARPQHGGAGALYLLLKRKREPRS